MFTFKVDHELELALVQPSFVKDYYKIVSSERDYLAQWLNWPLHAQSEEFFISFIKHSLHDYAEGKSLTCALIFQKQVVGNICYSAINQELKKVEIGYWLSAEHQGKGIVTRAVKALITNAFDELGMEKVQISVAAENYPSRKVCEKLGMNQEGIITNAENLNGQIVDHVIYGLHHSIQQ
ncbi:GNAT family N-acetyltransferase [Zooshikella harenae]|uniref:GNAT family N-acetyltransferase n=1 Tax=Zooshikella harenae TaxID=2827238 RepID=A0ABS5ZIQ2_9GAMM|nr:GNAT family protein [Zooshikella harenae]MBU2713845.1 GNAT family N-acetyltransferase [Zooshikella harenae]